MCPGSESGYGQMGRDVPHAKASQGSSIEKTPSPSQPNPRRQKRSPGRELTCAMGWSATQFLVTGGPYEARSVGVRASSGTCWARVTILPVCSWEDGKSCVHSPRLGVADVGWCLLRNAIGRGRRGDGGDDRPSRHTTSACRRPLTAPGARGRPRPGPACPRAGARLRQPLRPRPGT